MKDFGRLKYSADKKNSKQLSKLTLLGWVLLILAGGGLLVLLITNLSGFYSSQTLTAEYQTLEESFAGESILIREERVIYASSQGEVEFNIEEGEKISAGENIITLVNEGQTEEIYNYEPGVVSYKLDGLEEKFEPQMRTELSYDQINNLQSNKKSLPQGAQVNIGDPLLKIINNFTFYLAVLFPQEKLSKYEVGNEVEVVFSDLEGVQPFKGEIDEILFDKPDNIMIIKLTKFVPELIGIRKTDTVVIKDKYHGIVLPKSALKENEAGQVGVEIRGQVRDYFKEVEVKHEVEDRVVVKGILPGLEVIVK
jgi:putative membrane fusion protein